MKNYQFWERVEDMTMLGLCILVWMMVVAVPTVFFFILLASLS